MASNNNNFEWDAPFEFDPVPVPDSWEMVANTPFTPQPPLPDIDPLIFKDYAPDSESVYSFSDTKELETLVMQEERVASGASSASKEKEPRFPPTTEVIDLEEEVGVQPEESRTGRGRITAGVDVTTISFDLIRVKDHPSTYNMVMYDESSSEVVEVPGVKDESRLVFPHLLKRWKKETRERPDGNQDEFFSHSGSNEVFRSANEVVKFIMEQNNLMYRKHANNVENKLKVSQDHQRHHHGISEADPSASSSSSNPIKRFRTMERNFNKQ
ncbi:OLC1v1025367C1 [Oldenlandia corymbosa var. corymbosa]|uniref:OLC1v1025367C1 n=1 Tax=Oldenlandia corymbosa var. corymbosa TaxID=529605 RepID=A0AAV1C4Q1_OLDCO|nr:OLC1v1025367C1 [Oldenlandia corymbosa var. corymbosa]